MASKILADYGVKINKTDPSRIHFPPTTNNCYGLLNFVSGRGSLAGLLRVAGVVVSR